jgi:hypothetical protein
MTDKYRETLIVIDCVIFDKQQTKFFFDTTYEEAVNYIWDSVCPTALILYAWQYSVHNPIAINIKKKKLTDQELSDKYKKY